MSGKTRRQRKAQQQQYEQQVKLKAARQPTAEELERERIIQSLFSRFGDPNNTQVAEYHGVAAPEKKPPPPLNQPAQPPMVPFVPSPFIPLKVGDVAVPPSNTDAKDNIVVRAGLAYDEKGKAYHREILINIHAIQKQYPHIIIGGFLGNGSNGSVYYGCYDSNKNCQIAIKIGEAGEAETAMNLRAGQLGLAPKVYPPLLNVSYTEPLIDKGVVVGETKGMTNMLKMDAMTANLKRLLIRGEATLQDADEIAMLFKRFYDSNFMHHDMKADNV